MISATDYVRTAKGSAWYVPDLVPSHRPPRLVLVFESPHVDELEAKTPVVGSAGRSALRFLLPDTQDELSLGELVSEMPDLPVAIMNVSNVPLQRAAFARDKTEPGLTDNDWAVLGRVRRSTTGNMRGEIAQEVSTALVAGLRGRLDLMNPAPDCLIVASGRFAECVLAKVPLDGALAVPHPARNQWLRGGHAHRLRFARDRFQELVLE